MCACVCGDVWRMTCTNVTTGYLISWVDLMFPNSTFYQTLLSLHCNSHKQFLFHSEHRILKKKSEREKEYGLSNNRDDLRKNLIARMESLTHASEDVCVSILERNSYDLETSVEAYLSDSRHQNNY